MPPKTTKLLSGLVKIRYEDSLARKKVAIDIFHFKD